MHFNDKPFSIVAGGRQLRGILKISFDFVVGILPIGNFYLFDHQLGRNSEASDRRCTVMGGNVKDG